MEEVEKMDGEETVEGEEEVKRENVEAEVLMEKVERQEEVFSDPDGLSVGEKKLIAEEPEVPTLGVWQQGQRKGKTEGQEEKEQDEKAEHDKELAKGQEEKQGQELAIANKKVELEGILADAAAENDTTAVH